MPKRKRSSNDQDDSISSHNRVRNSRQNDFNIHLISARKQLRSALKTAKGFERQRLGKRLTNATKAADAVQMSRIRKEIEALKMVDLDKVVEQRLARGLGKIKVMAESGFFPAGWGESGEGVKGWEGEKGEEDIKVWNNVVSGMWNFKIVKSVWEGVIRGSYMSMGILAPVMEKGKKGKDKVKEKAKGDYAKKSSKKMESQSEGDDSDVDMENTIQKPSKKQNKEESWEGFDSPGDDEDEEDSEDDEENEGNDSFDEETLSRYDALLGASSDEESFDEEEYLKKNPSTSKSNTRLSLSLSPTPSRSPSPAPSISLSDNSADNKSSISRRKPSPSLSPEPETQSKAKKPKKSTTITTPDPTKNSTFLPTLMGGYWSGSESSASSLSDTDMKPTVRKNRMGQKARQALWEKKFGKGAKHIAAGGLSIEQEREMKRAEKMGKKVKLRDVNKGRKGDFRNDKTNANMLEVKPRERIKTRDDVGVLHPSWEAAKKAKDEKAKATFSGKKVVFD
ncbi:hypothetical protein SS1G_02337 [Sclerotinia sclerotiorum 1980 UF-70]|uniref:Bud22 domain-containing protein n=2 Tax=Sclerotinia sclerotiorum (strain ATCC 18683 / 1980 / Ss-1) TaxID=665079 RepID=A7EAK5_SCLS1|nr:hypothetical protein SS1G_02337 [Sclerotinia sclerotiorum 1980 UF-70]APA08614.1 hypothetical protein sscle_04g033840 [Sclerotinia sclerotiorum 1980 UF-70]EDN99483.1 hypothetical protein SS1G_02337 [Sclerotinia sclerotiorum 1980 UF-70]